MSQVDFRGVVYGFPNFYRLRAGVGNMLTVWAKCELFCREHACPMLAPQWTQPKLGPLFRGERDLRYYLGVFRHPPHYIRGPRRLWLTWRGRRVDSAAVPPEGLTTVRQDRTPTLVEFYDVYGSMGNVFDERDFVRRQLDTIISDSTRALVEKSLPGEPFIAAHVRRGDKPLMRLGDPADGTVHLAMPEEWFIRAIETARRKLGASVPVCVFTDGWPHEVARLTTMPNVRLAGTPNALADILLMSRATALIASGTSSFSVWASFLGGMPTLWHPGLRVTLNRVRPWFALQTDQQGNVPDEFERAYREFNQPA